MFERLRFLGVALPYHGASPAEFAQRALMKFVARSVAVEFGEPPFAAVRRRGAVLAILMPVPKAAVDENRNALFDQHNIRSDETRLRWLRVES